MFLNHSNIEAVLNERQLGDFPRTTNQSITQKLVCLWFTSIYILTDISVIELFSDSLRRYLYEPDISFILFISVIYLMHLQRFSNGTVVRGLCS